MARVAASVAVFLSLLFLFSFSYARDIHYPFPESETATATATEINRGPETTNSNSKPQQHDTVSFTLLDTSDPVPLTFVSFRPINRHVPLRPSPLPLSLRFSHRRCGHGHRREISYGNDGIVRSDAAIDPPNRGVVRQIPTRWTRFRHAELRFPEMIAHHHHHHIHSKHREEEHEEGWFSKRIRMFLNLF